ncbi:MAG: hypothetical protein IJI71_00305, partial [Clostridia bacterium]|nr:hypothetical protein [Clostridia bacterium]
AFTPPALRYPSLCAFVPVPSSYPLSGLLLLPFRAPAPTFTIAYMVRLFQNRLTAGGNAEELGMRNEEWRMKS